MTNLLRNLRHKMDASMQGISMYKGLLFGLIAVLLVGEIFALAGLISISATGLALTTLVVAAACFASNQLFSWFLKVPTNSESWLISALIISCIVAPSTDPTRVGLAALAGVAAMASKYVLAWRGSVIFNPAAAGVFIAGLTGSLPAIWWIATPWMLLITVPVALATLYKHRKFTVFAAFFAAAFAVLLIINGMTQNDSVSTVLELALVSWPLIFMGSIMLTEPTTMPAPRYLQLFYAVIVGALTTAQLQYGPVETSPQLALLIGNIFVAFIMPPWTAKLRLLERNKLTTDIEEFVFAKPKDMDYQAGQYVDWTLGHKKADFRGTRRRFSLASAPSEKELRFATRFTAEKQSSFKAALANMDSDDYIRASTIKGEFVLPKGDDKLLFIAGGIGITPFRSMIVELMNQKLTRDIVLVYASSSKEFAYEAVLKKAKKNGIKTFLTDKRLDATELERLVPDVLERQAYISGPDAMVTGYGEMLSDLGLKHRAIHTDHFSGY